MPPPTTAPPVSFFTQEWNRLFGGLSGLTPEQQAEAIAGRIRGGGTPSGGNVITTPGLGDIFHTGPAYRPTSADFTEYWGAKSAGRPPNLSPEAIGAVEEASRKAFGSAHSAQPEWSEAFGQIATAFDNIQDFAATIAAIGRLSLWAGLWGIGHASPLAGRIVERGLIPGLGMILLASDLLNFLAWAAMLAMVGYGAICAKPGQAIAAALPAVALRGVAGVRPCGVKARMGSVLDSNPFAFRAKMFERVIGRKGVPTLPELLQFAQTLDQLGGVGLSFGAIVGAVMEAAYGAAIIAAGGSVGFNTPLGTIGATKSPTPAGGGNRYLGRPVGVRGWDLVERRLAGANLYGLEMRYQGAACVVNAPLWLDGASELTEHDQLLGLVAACGGWDLIRQDLAGVDVPALFEWALAQPIAPGGVMSARTAAIIRGQGLSVESAGHWPLPGAPVTLRGAELVAEYGRRIPTKLYSFLAARRNEPVGLVYGGLFTGYLRSVWSVLGADPRGMRTEWTEESRFLLSMAEAHRNLIPTVREDAVWRFFQAGIGRLRDSGRGALLGSELDALAAEQGLQLYLAEQAFLTEPI